MPYGGRPCLHDIFRASNGSKDAAGTRGATWYAGAGRKYPGSAPSIHVRVVARTASDRIPNDNEYAEFRVWPMRILGRRDGPEQEIVQACGKALGTRGGIQDLNESFRPLVPLYCRSRPEADPLAQIPGDRQLVLSFGS